MKNYFEIPAYMYFILDRIRTSYHYGFSSRRDTPCNDLILCIPSNDDIYVATFNFHVLCKYLLQWMKIR